ncbi:hypothetical protein VPIG_00049 [Vibrio phage PWH3a-P1]|uniref:hypothetical protein n=1 Tax=Vibrio phage PWH3a-P1 TaxID=754058 RepID=UPI0002C0A539|nr:hypothetical protein VPIG_00049 [Vibrio phage PWH3a-P1]AGH31907.1 hypothetical protein VPIG_00049 [Vibrio phage PWH3a-P1]
MKNNIIIPEDKIGFTLTKDMTDREIEDVMLHMLELIRKEMIVPEDLLGDKNS